MLPYSLLLLFAIPLIKIAMFICVLVKKILNYQFGGKKNRNPRDCGKQICSRRIMLNVKKTTIKSKITWKKEEVLF